MFLSKFLESPEYFGKYFFRFMSNGVKQMHKEREGRMKIEWTYKDEEREREREKMI